MKRLLLFITCMISVLMIKNNSCNNINVHLYIRDINTFNRLDFLKAYDAQATTGHDIAKDYQHWLHNHGYNRHVMSDVRLIPNVGTREYDLLNSQYTHKIIASLNTKASLFTINVIAMHPEAEFL